MLVAGLILLKTSFSSPTLKVIFLLKTSILEWAVDKNGRPRIKGTSSSSELGRLPNPLSCKTLLICPICISKVLIEAPWFLIAASDPKSFHCVIVEYCPAAQFIGSLQVVMVHRTIIVRVGLGYCKPSDVQLLLVLEDVPLCHFWEYSAISWMAILALATVLEGMTPFESRIYRVGTSSPL
ncbi:hypothetical protein Tco_0730742 [Tanacetum coccineum]